MQLEHWIAHVATRTPDKVAIRYRDQRITYTQFEQLIGRLAWLLRHHYDIAPGDRVAHLALNNPIFLAMIFACARIGAVLVPLNFRLARPELEYLLSDSTPKVLIGEYALLTECFAYAIAPERCRFVSLDKSLDTSVCEELEPHLDGVASEVNRAKGSDPTVPMLIVYTSGTTGRPKGAVLDQNVIRWNAMNSQHMHGLNKDDEVVCVLPFFHVGGINIQTLPALHFGGTVTLLPTFDPAEVLRTIAEVKATQIVLVPTQMQAICALPEWPDADLTSLRAVATGSTTVDTGLLETWQAHGVRTVQVYGCTESGPLAIYERVDGTPSELGSVGRQGKHCRARIVDQEGVPVASGTKGEIQLQGLNIMSGYWNNPEATASTIREGWLSTGDIGYQDDDGQFFVVDRIKNVIISGGENIYPAEIERVLLKHPDIDEAAVVGLPDAKWGETVAAAIVDSAGKRLDDAAVLEFLEDKVGRYKLPRHIAFMPDLPRNVMGKVDYAAVRSRFMAPG